MEVEETILKTKINVFSVGLFLSGMILFGYFTFITLVSPMKSNNDFNAKDLLILRCVVSGAFVLLFIICSYRFFNLKILSLTKQNITINYPFLLSKKSIPISKIKNVVEKNNVYMLSRMRYDNAIFKEKEATIEFIDGSKINVDFSQAENYTEFKKRLSEIIQVNDTTANTC